MLIFLLLDAALSVKFCLRLVGLSAFKHVRAEAFHAVRHFAELIPSLLLLRQ
jgi:hypothetical protein